MCIFAFDVLIILETKIHKQKIQLPEMEEGMFPFNKTTNQIANNSPHITPKSVSL
jgi:hypothetical protein